MYNWKKSVMVDDWFVLCNSISSPLFSAFLHKCSKSHRKNVQHSWMAIFVGNTTHTRELENRKFVSALIHFYKFYFYWTTHGLCDMSLITLSTRKRLCKRSIFHSKMNTDKFLYDITSQFNNSIFSFVS